MSVSHAELLAAVRTVDELLGIGDSIYTVRGRVNLDNWQGSTWGHPDVVRYGEAADVVKRALAEAPK